MLDRSFLGKGVARCVRPKDVGRSGKLATSVVFLGILPLLCTLDLSMATKGTSGTTSRLSHPGGGAASCYQSAETCLEAAAT